MEYFILGFVENYEIILYISLNHWAWYSTARATTTQLRTRLRKHAFSHNPEDVFIKIAASLAKVMTHMHNKTILY